MHLISLSFDELVNEGVCSKFARILSNPVAYDNDLDSLIGRTNWDYFIPEDARNVIPLWDSNADTFARWERAGKIEYVWLFHDDPNWVLMATSEQGIKAQLWSKWCEFHEDPKECYLFAEAINFSYCDEALKVWERDYDEFQQWKLALTD
jgi:hypothetical protein